MTPAASSTPDELSRTSRPPLLVGRGAELSELRRAVEHARQGRSQAVLLEGEAGLGKTRLVEEAMAELGGQGVVVLSGAADELERDRPFRALAHVFGLEPRSPDPDRAEIARLLETDGSLDALTKLADAAFTVVESVVALLERLAAEVPVVVVFEDLHWADLATLRAVRTIVRRLPAQPVTLLGTLRPSPRLPELDLLVDDVVGRGGRLVRLRPVNEEAVTALAAEVAGAAPGSRLRARLGSTGGNPLFVMELVRALAEEGALQVREGCAEVEDGPLPTSLRLTVLRRLSRLPEATVDLLRVASIFGASFSVAELSALTGQRQVEVVHLLDAALRSDLLRESGRALAFRHELVREAIYEDLAPALRIALHREAGHALAAAGAPAAQVASHLVLGAAPGDTEAVGWLRRAAVDAAPHAPAAAVELLERALTLAGPRHYERGAVVTELAPLLLQVGRAGDAQALAAEALTHVRASPVRAGLHRALGQVLWAQGHLFAAVSELEAALAEPGLAQGSRLVPLAIAANARLFMGQRQQARAQAEEARALGQRLGDDAAVSLALQTLAVAAQAEGFVGRAVHLAEEAVAVAAASRHPAVGYLHPHFSLGAVLLDADRLDDAEAALQEGRRQAEARGNVVWLPLYHCMLAMRRVFSGDWDDALAETEAGLGRVEDTGTRLHASFLLGIRAWLALERGELELAEARYAEAAQEFGAVASSEWKTAEQVGGPKTAGALWPVEWGIWTLALLTEVKCEVRPLAASGKRLPEQAPEAEALRPVFALMADAWDLAAPLRHFLSSRPLGVDMVRLALATGNRDRATAVTEELEEFARRCEVPSALGAALLCRGLVDEDPQALAAAVETYSRSARLLDRALAGERLGTALAAMGRQRQAIVVLEEALELCAGFGARRAMARTEAVLRALGVRRRPGGRRRRATAGWEALTPSELSVVRLVAEGLTNPQIAGRLFISRRTVDAHLSHVFRKLGVASRAQLAVEVARRS